MVVKCFTETDMRILITAVLAATAALPAFADGNARWYCRNMDMEISCSDDTCQAADVHTPMVIHLSPEELSLCAYTGCWTGQPSETVSSGRLQTFVAIALPFSTSPDSFADVSVTVDTETGTATVMVAGQYAHPATCTRAGLKVTIE